VQASGLGSRRQSPAAPPTAVAGHEQQAASEAAPEVIVLEGGPRARPAGVSSNTLQQWQQTFKWFKFIKTDGDGRHWGRCEWCFAGKKKLDFAKEEGVALRDADQLTQHEATQK
jgi:hypothetical protein